MNKPLEFAIGPSLIQLGLIWLSHGVAIVACWLNSLTIVERIIFSLIVSVSLIIQLWGYNEKYLPCLKFFEQKGWELTITEDQTFLISIDSASVLCPWMMVLYCRSPQQIYTLVLFKDALPSGEFRRLLATIRTSALGMGN